MLIIAVCGRAELPIPKDPQWAPVKDEVYLQEIEGTIKTSEPLLAASVLDNVLYVSSPLGVLRLQNHSLIPAGGPQGTVKRLKTLRGALFAFTTNGLWRLDQNTWNKISDDNFTDGCVHL